MNGHDAHLVAGDLHVALHLGARPPQPSHKTLQRRRLATLLFKGEIEEFIKRIVGLGAEAREEAVSAAAGAKHLRIKIERRLALGRIGQFGKTGGSLCEYWPLEHSAAERSEQR